MSAKMTTAQKNSAVKDYAMSALSEVLANVGAVQFGDYKYAIPVTVDGEERWAKLDLTAGNNKDTKTTKAFNPYTEAEVWRADKAEKAEIAEAKAKAKAEKIAKDKAKREG